MKAWRKKSRISSRSWKSTSQTRYYFFLRTLNSVSLCSFAVVIRLTHKEIQSALFFLFWWITTEIACLELNSTQANWIALICQSRNFVYFLFLNFFLIFVLLCFVFFLASVAICTRNYAWVRRRIKREKKKKFKKKERKA